MAASRILTLLALAAGTIAACGAAFAEPTPAGRASGDLTIATADSDTAWVSVDRGPRLHVIAKEAGRGRPHEIDIDMSGLGEIIAEAMREVSRSLHDLDVETSGAAGDRRIVIRADGKETEVDVDAILRDVRRDIERAVHEVDRELERHRPEAESRADRQAGGADPTRRIIEARAALAADRAALREEMAALREELAALKSEIEKTKEHERRRH